MKKGDLRRGQILDAAEKLFFERGYDATSIQDILDALNLSKGGFYHYFDAKRTVLKEICERRWEERYDKIKSELFASRRSLIERLNLLLKQANLFEAEDVSFAALMLKICYRERDAAMRDYRRRVLIDSLSEQVDAVMAEGKQEGTLHARRPAGLGRLLLLLACDVNDEACQILATDEDNPDRMIHVIDLLHAYRDSVELLSGAPYGSIELFDAGGMVQAWQAATKELIRLEEEDT